MMQNRIYGVIGIKSIMSNWNADFTGGPRMTGNSEIYGSYQALKYIIRIYWMNNDEDVFSVKSLKIDKQNGKEKIQPKSISERYSELFKVKKIEEQSPKEVLINLFSMLDVMNFGIAFTHPGHNYSITGAVQISQGYNKYKNSQIIIQNIQCPFRNPKEDDAEASTLGTKIITDEAHYFYPFVVNPDNYKDYTRLIEGFNGYTHNAYQKFKEAALISATAFHSGSKIGCENEFALFIECKDGMQVNLPDLTQYIVFEKEKDKDCIDINGLEFLNERKFKDAIDKIELYYNPYLTKVKMDFNAKKYNIITKDELQ